MTRTTKSRASSSPDPSDGKLAARLAKLGLYGVMKELSALGATALIERLVEIEELERTRRSLERRVKSAKIGKMKMMADFDWSWPKKIDRESIEEILRMEFVDQAVNVILVGPNGIGKTMIAQNLAHEAVMKGRSALFINAAELMAELRKPETALGLSRRLATLARPDLLVVDELGYLAASDRDGDLFFQLISRRYEKKSTLITTNKPFTEWNSVFPNSACTVTLVDRLVHRAEIVVLDGDSYRMKEAKEREEDRRKRRKAKQGSSGKAAGRSASADDS